MIESPSLVQINVKSILGWKIASAHKKVSAQEKVACMIHLSNLIFPKPTYSEKKGPDFLEYGAGHERNVTELYYD